MPITLLNSQRIKRYCFENIDLKKNYIDLVKNFSKMCFESEEQNASRTKTHCHQSMVTKKLQALC